jgi:hypothetical protein
MCMMDRIGTTGSSFLISHPLHKHRDHPRIFALHLPLTTCLTSSAAADSEMAAPDRLLDTAARQPKQLLFMSQFHDRTATTSDLILLCRRFSESVCALLREVSHCRSQSHCHCCKRAGQLPIASRPEIHSRRKHRESQHKSTIAVYHKSPARPNPHASHESLTQPHLHTSPGRRRR